MEVQQHFFHRKRSISAIILHPETRPGNGAKVSARRGQLHAPTRWNTIATSWDLLVDGNWKPRYPKAALSIITAANPWELSRINAKNSAAARSSSSSCAGLPVNSGKWRFKGLRDPFPNMQENTTDTLGGGALQFLSAYFGARFTCEISWQKQ